MRFKSIALEENCRITVEWLEQNPDKCMVRDFYITALKRILLVNDYSEEKSIPDDLKVRATILLLE